MLCIYLPSILLTVLLCYWFWLVGLFVCYICIVPTGFLLWEIRVAFPGESRLGQSRATQPMVHAGYFIISIIQRTLTGIRASLTCEQMVMHKIAHGGARTHVRESALKTNPCRTGESNLRQTACRSDTLPTQLHPYP